MSLKSSAKNKEIWRDLAQAFEAAAAPRLPLDEWARKYVTIPDGPRKGPWNPANAPMALEPMRAVGDSRVRQVTLCTPAQLMKSVFATNVAVWTAAYGESVLFYEPDRELLQRMFRDRMRPAFMGLMDGAVQDRKGGHKKEDGSLALRLQGGGLILGLTPQMKTGKSAYTARTVVLDEIDKMGDQSMITTAESRTLTYGSDSMIVVVSTPTIDAPGTSWRQWTQGSRGRWHGLCPHCRDLVRVDWSRVQFDKDEDGFWLPATAAMHCGECGTVWSESDRQRAVRSGAYVHEDPENPHKSYHIPGTAHIFRDLRWIVDRGAESFRQAIVEGTWEDYQQWWNERLAEPWTDEYQGLSASLMKRTTYSLGARGEDDEGELDRRAVLITAGVDAGAHALYAEWVAWGIDPQTGQVLSWGLQYRIIGGRPDDDVEDPDLWRDFDKLLDSNVWRHPAYSDSRIPVQRVLIDCAYRPDVVRIWCEEKYAHDVRNTGQAMLHPYGARVLPSRGKAQEVGEHLVDLSDGRNRKVRQQPRFPAMVWLHTNMLKNTIYDIGLRDKRLPDGAPKQQMWPLNPEAHGYTEAWFREFANEVRMFHRTPKGTPTSHWQVKAGQGKKNEAWDCRVYATGAAVVHCQLFGPVSLQAGLLQMAIQDGTQNADRWTPDEMALLHRHLHVAGTEGYAEGSNVTPLR